MSSIRTVHDFSAGESIEHPERGRIMCIKQMHLPQFRFEYHPKVGKVYAVELGGTKEVGNEIAANIHNEGVAVMVALIWSRGFKYATLQKEQSHGRHQDH